MKVSRLDEIITYLEQMASGDLSIRLPVGNSRDQIDALAYGINILADEIQFKQVQEEKRMRDLEEMHLHLSKTLNELKMTQDQLIQAAKLAILGEICAGLAHEVSNPLSTIGGYIDSISSLVKKHSSVIEKELNPFIEKTHLQIERIVEIITHVRNFSRKPSKDFTLVNLHEVIDASLSLFEQQFRNLNIKIEKHLPVPDLNVMGNFILLEQVLINILANAKDAILNGKTENGIIRIEQSTRGRGLQIKIIDNGIGLDPAIKSKVFDPFFTTKKVGSGTGIGLSISQGIVESHQGNIYIDSHDEYSTVVTIELPEAEKGV